MRFNDLFKSVRKFLLRNVSGIICKKLFGNLYSNNIQLCNKRFIYHIHATDFTSAPFDSNASLRFNEETVIFSKQIFLHKFILLMREKQAEYQLLTNLFKYIRNKHWSRSSVTRKWISEFYSFLGMLNGFTSSTTIIVFSTSKARGSYEERKITDLRL